MGTEEMDALLQERGPLRASLPSTLGASYTLPLTKFGVRQARVLSCMKCCCQPGVPRRFTPLPAAGATSSRSNTQFGNLILCLTQVRDAAFLHRYNEPVLLLLHEADKPTWAGEPRLKVNFAGQNKAYALWKNVKDILAAVRGPCIACRHVWREEGQHGAGGYFAESGAPAAHAALGGGEAAERRPPSDPLPDRRRPRPLPASPALLLAGMRASIAVSGSIFCRALIIL